MSGKKTASKTASTSKLSKAATEDDEKTLDLEARELGEPRKFTPRSYRSPFRRTKAARSLARNKIPNSFIVFYRSVRMLTTHWNVFGGVLLIYAAINLVLIGGFSNGASLQDTKDSLSDVFTGDFSKLSTGLTLFGFLIQSGSSVASGAASAYQTVVLILVSLAFIWGLRQLHAGNKIRVRDTFYQSSYPLVQVMLVLLIVSAQLVPAVVGATLFTTLILNGIILIMWQKVIIGLLCLAFVVWSLYMLTASVFAIYIATLPEMTPLTAYRSAKEIVRHRRTMVLRRLVFLPLMLIIISAVIMVPLAILATNVATAVFFMLTVASVPVVHSYMYSLYRILIDR